CAATGYYFDYW
nr:immunoglobulin heavy chain junction region [Mus musculus]MBK4189275.1 immunoglobulin heavy chain junction region [Mus musculus]